MSPLMGVLFLVMLAFEALSLYNSILHKQKEEKLKKEINRLKKEISRLQEITDEIPDAEQFQEKLSDFESCLSDARMKLNEKKNILDMDLNRMNKRISLYQAEKDEITRLLIQCEEVKSGLEIFIQNARNEISGCYYEIQEKIEKLHTIAETPPQTSEIRKPASVRIRKCKPDENVLNLLEMVDSMSQRISRKETGIRFEKIMCVILKANGFSGIETTLNSNDDGIDIFAERNHLTFAVQCKCYLNDVDKKAIQEVSSGNLKYQKDKAVAVTNRHFNSYARQLAAEVQVELWEREQLIKMMCKLSEDEIAKCAAVCAKPEFRTVKAKN